MAVASPKVRLSEVSHSKLMSTPQTASRQYANASIGATSSVEINSQDSVEIHSRELPLERHRAPTVCYRGHAFFSRMALAARCHSAGDHAAMCEKFAPVA